MIPLPTVKVKYLTNKDLLEQIHVSKKSYCSYLDPVYADFDVITRDLGSCNADVLTQARQKRAETIYTKERKACIAAGIKTLPIRIDPETIDIEGVVVRLMTYDHIPPHPLKSLTGKTEAEKHVKVNFPAFQHYIWKDDDWQCVGKSHWKNGLSNGEFCVNHGKMTNKLALMFMKLVEKYSRKGNWRNYSYNDEMQCQALLQLSQIGLQFDESKSENPFAYYTAACSNSFVRILNTEKRSQNIRDDLLVMHGATPSNTRIVENSMAQQTPPPET